MALTLTLLIALVSAGIPEEQGILLDDINFMGALETYERVLYLHRSLLWTLREA
jgi:hypothetical protein